MSAEDARMPLVDLWDDGRVIVGDAATELRELPANTIQCCVTSPPYYQQRDYGIEGQIGNEPTPGEFIARLVEVFAEVRRVMRPDGGIL